MKKHFPIISLFFVLFLASPSRAGLYSKDFKIWEGEWEYNNSNDLAADYGYISITDCHNNKCKFELYAAYGHEPVPQCGLEGYFRIVNNEGIIISDESGEKYIEDVKTNKKKHLKECMQFELDKNNAVLRFIFTEKCSDENFCGARAHLNSQTLTSPFLKKDKKTYKTSFRCDNLSRHSEVLICQDSELASLDIELSEIYRYKKDLNPSIVSSQVEWLKERDTCCNGNNAKERLKKSYINRIYYLSSENTYAPVNHTSHPFIQQNSNGLHTLNWIGVISTYRWRVDINDQYFNLMRELTINNCFDNTCDFQLTLGMEEAFYPAQPIYSGKGTFTADSPYNGTTNNIAFSNMYKFSTSNIEEDEITTYATSILRQNMTTICSFRLEYSEQDKNITLKPEKTSDCKLPDYFFTELNSEKELTLVYTTSYDCYKVSNLAEKTVCTTETLANLDIELANLYKDASAVSPSIKTSQKEWIKKKNACEIDSDCLDYEYKRHIIDLYKIIRTKGTNK